MGAAKPSSKGNGAKKSRRKAVLTKGQIEFLIWIDQGQTSPTVDAPCLEKHSIRTVRHRIHRRLKVDNDAEALECARQLGLLPGSPRPRLTMAASGSMEAVAAPRFTGDDVRAFRERERISQAWLASRLGVSAGYLSQLERGIKPLKGPLLRFLHAVCTKGIDFIL